MGNMQHAARQHRAFHACLKYPSALCGGQRAQHERLVGFNGVAAYGFNGSCWAQPRRLEQAPVITSHRILIPSQHMTLFTCD